MSHISTCLKTSGCDVEQTAKEYAAPQFITYINEATAFSLFILLPILIYIFAKYGSLAVIRSSNANKIGKLMKVGLVLILVVLLPLALFLFGYSYQFEACYERECSVFEGLSYLFWPLLVLLCTVPISALLLKKTNKK